MNDSDWVKAPKVRFDLRVKIWCGVARGDTDTAIQTWLETEVAQPPDRKTIRLVREELEHLPRSLYNQVPESVIDYCQRRGWPVEAESVKYARSLDGRDGDTRPRLYLGDPQPEDKEVLTRTHMGLATPDQIVHYRVPVGNEGEHAFRVTVRLLSVEPALDSGLPRPVLHLAGDNPPDYVSYERSRGFPLSTGEEELIDVIAMSKKPPHACYIWSIASRDAVEEHQLNGLYVLTIGAFTAGSEPATRAYQLEVDATGGHLRMSSR